MPKFLSLLNIFKIAGLIKGDQCHLNSRQIQKIQLPAFPYICVSKLCWTRQEYPTGTPGTQQAFPKYEATCPSQPWIPGLGMVRPGSRAQTLSKEMGGGAPLPTGLFQLQENNPLRLQTILHHPRPLEF